MNSKPFTTTRGFTLIELLVVLSIIGILIAVLIPALSAARGEANGVVCGSTLHQLGLATSAYIVDHQQRMPYIDSALFEPGGNRNWLANPMDSSLYPRELPTVMKSYLSDFRVMRCPSAILGYPEPDYAISYRMSSADNLDGNPQTLEQLHHPGGNWVYNYDLKYLNGRPYELLTKDENFTDFLFYGWPTRRGVGEYYVFRDFVNQKNGQWLTSHHAAFNQLHMDMHVKLIKTDNFHGLTDDRPGD